MPLAPRLRGGGWGGYNSNKAARLRGGRAGEALELGRSGPGRCGGGEAPGRPAKKAKAAIAEPWAKATSFCANLK